MLSVFLLYPLMGRLSVLSSPLLLPLLVQEYNYGTLGQSQFPQFYTPSSYPAAGLTVTSAEGDGGAVTGYQVLKTEDNDTGT